jgi:ADP-ribose pyrophosphatase
VGHVFVWGVTAHAPVLKAVLGREVRAEPVALRGWRAVSGVADGFPGMMKGAGEVAGLLLRDASPVDVARLAFFAGGQAAVCIDLAGIAAEMFPGAVPGTVAWDSNAWAARWGATAAEAVSDMMRLYGVRPAGDVAARWPQMLTRAGASLRARVPGLESLRRRAGPVDVEEAARRQPYAAYFAVEEYDLRFRRFDGAMSEVLTRAVFISGDAAVVLPYDPVRDCVLVIEQWRAGPHARGDGQQWLIEAVAGRVDGGESPEDAARREAREEAGLTLREVIPAAQYYPSPAAKAEYLFTYVGLADLPDGAAGIGGLQGEGEDIRAHVIPFHRLMALVASGEVNNAPLILLAFWLDRNRADLRRAAGVGSGPGG